MCRHICAYIVVILKRKLSNILSVGHICPKKKMLLKAENLKISTVCGFETQLQVWAFKK